MQCISFLCVCEKNILEMNHFNKVALSIAVIKKEDEYLSSFLFVYLRLVLYIVTNQR